MVVGQERCRRAGGLEEAVAGRAGPGAGPGMRDSGAGGEVGPWWQPLVTLL